MANTFDVGDTVRLKSGGPKMTVESVDPDIDGEGTAYVYCAWFVHNEKKTGSFPAKALERF